MIDCIGKFAVLHGRVEEDDDFSYRDDVTEAQREAIGSSDFVHAEGRLDASPVTSGELLLAAAKDHLYRWS